MKKTIRYHVRETYGVTREYVTDPFTGRDTIDGRIRELVRDLTGGLVAFEQVLRPTITS